MKDFNSWYCEEVERLSNIVETEEKLNKFDDDSEIEMTLRGNYRVDTICVNSKYVDMYTVYGYKFSTPEEEEKYNKYIQQAQTPKEEELPLHPEEHGDRTCFENSNEIVFSIEPREATVPLPLDSNAKYNTYRFSTTYDSNRDSTISEAWCDMNAHLYLTAVKNKANNVLQNCTKLSADELKSLDYHVRSNSEFKEYYGQESINTFLTYLSSTIQKSNA